jgi:uncharacterized protein (TIGR00369 family)
MAEIDLTDDQFCFVCGRNNPDGLRLNFEYPEPGRCRAVYIPECRFQGWKDILHGGIVSTLLDEAIMHAWGWRERGAGGTAVTAEITVRFKKPVRIGKPVILEGWILSDAGRMIRGESTLKDETGQVLASAAGKLIKPKKAASGDEL